jgi:hypothetical protein
VRGPHGPKLKPVPGRVLYGTEESPEDEHGKPRHALIPANDDASPSYRR